ncbi:glycine-rich cell wall structural protein 2-like [Neodiprion fabricii]|uniref:glycine-rich cell wall structural protein 2-like n=1 Tax=Neodiprion fabricii TaxID=2872261 RepID=UPI001ED92141|nr:glycine-rich cell wall structural protein 2-like [Neodiprion fabricii]
MRTTYLSFLFLCLLALNCAVVGSAKLRESASTTGSKVTGESKDLDASASSDVFHSSRDYRFDGGPGGESGFGGIRSGIGVYPGIEGGSIYGSGNIYQGAGLAPGYRGYRAGGYGNGIIGGGHTGYGYYGTTGYGSGSSGYGPNYGVGGLDSNDGIGSGVYDDGYSVYGNTRRVYNGYGGRDSAGYDSYPYRGSASYGRNGFQPSGYRGYS